MCTTDGSVVIRIAEQKDVQSLTKLAIETYTDAFGASMEASELAAHLATNFSEARIETCIREDVVLVAELAEQMIGFVHFSDINIFVATPTSTSKKLRKLYVHRDFQNKGVGSSLMAAALEHPLLKGAEYIYVEVWEHNVGAQKLYKHYGFEKIDQRRLVLPSGAEADFDLIMVRQANW